MSAVSFVFRTEKCLKVGLGCVTNIFGNEDVVLCALYVTPVKLPDWSCSRFGRLTPPPEEIVHGSHCTRN